MQIIRNQSDIQQVGNPAIRALVVHQIESLSEEGYALEEVGRIVVLDTTDTIATIEQYLGVSIGTYELLEEHPSCFDVLYVLDQAGFGVEVYVPKEEGIDADLLAMCQRFALKAQDGGRA